MWTKTLRHRLQRHGDGRLAFAAVCAAAAIVYLSVGLARGDLGLAVGGFVVMIAYGAGLLLLRRRAEPLALLSGNPADERQAQVMLRASAFTGQLVVAVLVVGLLVALAAGAHEASLLADLCGVAGLSFIGATVWYSRRG